MWGDCSVRELWVVLCDSLHVFVQNGCTYQFPSVKTVFLVFCHIGPGFYLESFAFPICAFQFTLPCYTVVSASLLVQSDFSAILVLICCSHLCNPCSSWSPWRCHWSWESSSEAISQVCGEKKTNQRNTRLCRSEQCFPLPAGRLLRFS